MQASKTMDKIDYKLGISAPFLAGITLTHVNQALAAISFLVGIGYTGWRWWRDIEVNRDRKNHRGDS